MWHFPQEYTNLRTCVSASARKTMEPSTDLCDIASLPRVPLVSGNRISPDTTVEAVASLSSCPTVNLEDQLVVPMKKTYSYKGVEYTFLDTVPEDVVCPVCRELLEEAQQTPCGHLFCRKCLKKIRVSHNRHFTCPVCRVQHFCKASELMNDKYNQRRVTNLRVKCPKVQCDWEGTVGKADDHKRGKCLFEDVPCSKGCGTLVLRSNLQSHISNDCRLRSLFCKFCHQEGTHEHITTDHCRECDEYPIQCPNQCRETVAKKSIEAHLSECPMQEIECRYNAFGCTAGIKRGEADEHETEHKDYHLRLSLEKMSLLFQTVSDMYCVMQSLSQRLEATERRPLHKHHSYHTTREPMHLPPNPLASFTSLRRPWLENKTLFPSSPWIFKLDQFERQRREKKVLYWKLFSHPAGYKFVIRADIKSDYDPDDYISAAYCTEGGPNDATLKWPFNGSVTVTLLNQVEDRNHSTRTISQIEEKTTAAEELLEVYDDSPEEYGRCTEPELGVAKMPWYCQYLKDDCQYLKDDCLFFRIEISQPRFSSPGVFKFYE